MKWPNLPEQYGEGQRQFDMAKSAHDALEPISYLAAMLAFVAAGRFVPAWLALAPAIGVYALAMIPAKRRLSAARRSWEDDMRAYQEFLDSSDRK